MICSCIPGSRPSPALGYPFLDSHQVSIPWFYGGRLLPFWPCCLQRFPCLGKRGGYPFCSGYTATDPRWHWTKQDTPVWWMCSPFCGFVWRSMETWICQHWKRILPILGRNYCMVFGMFFFVGQLCYTYGAPLSPQGFHATSRSSSNSSKRSPWMKGNGRRGGYIPRMLNFGTIGSTVGKMKSSATCNQNARGTLNCCVFVLLIPAILWDTGTTNLGVS